MYNFICFQSYNVHEIVIESTLHIIVKHIFATKSWEYW